ncbi:nucleotidyltransferase family protein, partial [Escherichia coli]|uniref:nucleotidyltransferase family protein n=1 Tax=Escherichia coli TaxID=562 RepID=UPI00345898AC
ERPATLAFGHTMIPTLPVEAAVAYAAFHGARHQWSRLYWLADIAMACRLPGLDWDKVDTIARRTGTARHLALALDLARDWLGSPAMLPRATGRDRE